MPNLFIHILFPNDLRPGDIEVIAPPAAGQPGQARLQRAIVGDPRPGAPNSLPLISQSQAPVGYVANINYMEAPYNDSYVITR